MSVEELALAAIARGQVPQLAQLGNEQAIWDAEESLVQSAVVPEILEMFNAEWNVLHDRERAIRFASIALSTIDRPALFSASIEAVLSNAAIPSAAGAKLGEILLGRIAKRTDDRAASLAARAMDGAVRLCLGGWWTRRYLLLDALVSVGHEENDLFATPVARLIGVCFEQWREKELCDALHRLLSVPESAGDAAFELGIAELGTAFDCGSKSDVLHHLRGASTWLARAEAAEEDRSDAKVYRLAVGLLLAFDRMESPDVIQSQLKALREALRIRHAWLSGTCQGWLRARTDAEVEWLRLADLLTRTAELVNQASWMRPYRALAQTLEAYCASRSIRLFSFSAHSPEGILKIVEPRIESAFIRERGLREHLERWVEECGTEADQNGAQTLLERVVAGEVHPTVQLGDPRASPPTWLERRYVDFAAARTRSSNPVIDDLLARIFSDLAKSTHFIGDIRADFEELVVLTIRFLQHRYDVNKSFGKGRWDYLFAPPKGEPLPHEEALQVDYWEYLSGSDLAGKVNCEVRNLSHGRVDVLIDYGGYKFVAEVKREESDASRQNLRQYLGQAGMYQGGHPTLGLLLVLDLTPKPHGPGHIAGLAWVDVVPAASEDDLPRYVVVVRVPGNIVPPSSAVTPP